MPQAIFCCLTQDQVNMFNHSNVKDAIQMPRTIKDFGCNLRITTLLILLTQVLEISTCKMTFTNINIVILSLLTQDHTIYLLPVMY